MNWSVLDPEPMEQRIEHPCHPILAAPSIQQCDGADCSHGCQCPWREPRRRIVFHRYAEYASPTEPFSTDPAVLVYMCAVSDGVTICEGSCVISVERSALFMYIGAVLPHCS